MIIIIQKLLTYSTSLGWDKHNGISNNLFNNIFNDAIIVKVSERDSIPKQHMGKRPFL